MSSIATPKQTNPHFNHADRAPYELGRLLRKMPANFSRINPLTTDDRMIAEAAREHAMTANDTLLHGLEAIGHLMFVAGAYNDAKIKAEVDQGRLSSLGCLISHIAVEVQFTQETEWSIRETLEAIDERATAETGKIRGRQ